MAALNSTVIETAAEAAANADSHEVWIGNYRDMAKAAILAADAARAEQGFVLVRRDDLRHALTALEYVVEIGLPDDPYVLAHREAIDRLTAALGDGVNVTEGE